MYNLIELTEFSFYFGLLFVDVLVCAEINCFEIRLFVLCGDVPLFDRVVFSAFSLISC